MNNSGTQTPQTPEVAAIELLWFESCNAYHLLAALDALGYQDDRIYRLFACWCVRQVWHLLEDERSKQAVRSAEAFADGRATQQDLEWACEDASDADCSPYQSARYAKEAASGAAWYGARGAANEALVMAAHAAQADVKEVVRSAAWQAAPADTDALAASSVAAIEAAGALAWQIARLAQAHKLRELVPWPRIAYCIRSLPEERIKLVASALESRPLRGITAPVAIAR